jgi:acyl-CoA reductase-like NAD-dependent aldehyde dehydrogenase
VEGVRATPNVNPSNTADVIDHYAAADAATATRAVAAARAAFPAWSLATPQQRFDALDRVGSELLSRKAELGDLLSREEGKTLAEGIGEVARAGFIFKFFAGDARDAKTQIGPVVDASQLEQDERYVAIGRSEGAKLVAGGERVKRDKEGFYLAPALFADCANGMRICQEEIFGPVAAVVRVKDCDEALALANDTSFGLTAGICTTSLKHAAHFKRHAQAGMVMVNVPTAGVDYHVPFGGRTCFLIGVHEARDRTGA